MAESRRYTVDNHLDIEQILLDAQSRWLRPVEICEILQNYRNFKISPEPPNKPPSGSLFLFDRKVLRYFRKDGHNWRKKKDGKTVNEAHERLKAGSIDVLHCYYAHGEENGNFQRRSYWLLEEAFMHIVLVHYREVKGSKTGFSRLRDNDTVSSSHSSSPLSSSVITNSNCAPSPTDSASLTSGPTSEFEDFESEFHQASSTPHSHLGLQHIKDEFVTSEVDGGLPNTYVSDSYPSNQYDKLGNPSVNAGLSFVSLSQEFKGSHSSDAGFELNFDAQKQLDLASWEQVLEHCNSGFGTPVSSTQCTTVSHMPEQENVILGKLYRDQFNIEQEDVGRSERQKKWQIASEDSSSNIYKWSLEQKLLTDPDPSQPFHMHPEQQKGNPLQNDYQTQLPNAEFDSLLNASFESVLNGDDIYNNYSSAKQPVLDSIRTDEILKKNDSFTRWMSKELGEVSNLQMQPISGVDWDTVGSVRVSDDASISSEYLETYSLSPSLSKEQLFSITDFSPNWAYEGSEAKVLITGKFLKNREDLEKYKWSCMFGEIEVPVEVSANGVLHCHAPQHTVGRVPFYVTCSNRVACSEVREFEFRISRTQDFIMTDPDSVSMSDMLLHNRLCNLLSLDSVWHPSYFDSLGENSYMNSNISLLMKEDGKACQMVKTTSEESYPVEEKEQRLQETLKENLNSWLLQKVTEEGKGPNVLDKEGQGVIHLASALGYDWAIAPTVAAGVNINFRDVNGWTALHWAAFCGRERTVGLLVSLNAAPGALTDPTPKFPSGRTPADLASNNGHKGIAGYLAESSLTIHLSSLTMKETGNGAQPDVTGVGATQKVLEHSATQFFDVNVPDTSLKDSLTAVRNATQAAARIHQVFRVQSFQRKQLVEYGDEKFGMSDERALSLISVKKKKQGVHDEPGHVAAMRIQNKFRCWKGRKEFLVIRQQIVKIQAHVRGHQVRKHYRSIIWSVGIVEKVILRWRRKGSGLRGFQSEALTGGSAAQSGPSKEDDYDFLKEGRKQTEERLQKALARVKSMVQYPEARDQYRRLMTVVTDFQETKVVYDNHLNTPEEASDGYDDMIDLESLLTDDTFMYT
ncbi:Calmodulin-binding transcription activator [Thalictrum thalictroides]|uniref:Calmodulin-binding transcription activator n=1 Tax=Thalictrum thalictroides TaxID=46969 RepID=A0A7J6V1E3_THATH|nr:Calmodulin-binding transcription activator [Thalictrum thalictroides]